MKTNKTLIATFAGIALFAFAGSAPAQYKAVGDDGIAASPKLRELIDARKSAQPAPTAVEPMACPKCKTGVTRRVDWTARGANKPTVLIAKHLCERCDTTISTTGQGKASRDVVTHGCSMSGGTCCKANKS